MKNRTYLLLCCAIFFSSCNSGGNSSGTSSSDSSISNNSTISNKNDVMQKRVSAMHNLKMAKDGSGFYAVCATDQPGGWCSGQCNSFEVAEAALQQHYTQTGHTDTSVENSCPFGQ